MTDLIAAVNDWALALAGTPWVFLVVYAFATIDGLFPPIPSESVIIGLAVLFVHQESPDFWVLGAVAAAGAFTGDQIAYSVGRRIPIRRLRFMQGPRAEKSILWAEQALRTRGASFIIAARYIPIGRVAVNMTAGATRFPRLRFSVLAAIAAISWSIYSVVLGISAGVWLKGHPFLALVVGVVGGLLIGVVVDQVLAYVGRRRGRRDGGGAADIPADAAPDPEADGPPRAEPAADPLTAGASERG